jgi:hypothetical protein
MSKRPNFDWPYILTELQDLGKAVKQKVTIFVAGGAAMAFLGLKIATKDIDVIVRTHAEVSRLDSCLRRIGYAPPKTTLKYLQKKGFDVTGVDISPRAIQVCRKRGLKKAFALSITKLSGRLGEFDTLLMFGNNFGLFGNPKKAKWLLRRFYKMTTDDARIIAESVNPYKTDDPDHRAYHRFNRQRGRVPGQIRIRVRYRKFVTPWFDYLLVSQQEMRNTLKGTGWVLKHILPSRTGPYIAIIGKTLR